MPRSFLPYSHLYFYPHLHVLPFTQCIYITFFISSHFFGKKDAENLALRDQGLCVAAHLFAEEINTESDLVGENLATKRDELCFQDVPIYNKLNISSAKLGEKPPPTMTRKRNTL